MLVQLGSDDPGRHPQLEDSLAPRDQILDAAAALFAESGYAGTSTRAIAERVGIRQASLYHHFAGKDDLLLELLETSVRPSLAFVDQLLAHPDPGAALHALASIDVGTLLATPHNVGALYLAHEVQQPRFDSFRGHRTELQSAYAALTGRITGEPSDFLGACCMQLVEMVIEARRDGRPLDRLDHEIPDACLRVIGLSATEVSATGHRGRQLREALATSAA